MAEAARLSVGIHADTGPLEVGLRRASSLVDGFGGGLARLGAFAATGAIAGVAGLTAGIGAAVSVTASFEKQMSAVQAVSGATAAEFEALSDAALRIGKDTSFSATQAAQAIEELVKAGVTIDEVLNGAADATVALAAATGAELAEAAEIASGVMNNFGKTGEQMTGVVNTITGAVNASAIDITDFRFSMASVGAVANQMGISMEDTAVAIAAMGQAGIKGSDAGTSLKTMFLNLIPDTNKARDTMRDLGLFTINSASAMGDLKDALNETAEGQRLFAKLTKDGTVNEENLFKAVKATTPAALEGAKSFTEFAQKTGQASNAFFDAAGNTRPMVEIFEELHKATKDLTKEQQILAIQTIFGTDAVRSASIAARLGAGGFAEMAEQMRVQGDAAETARKRLDNLSGDLEQLKGSAETAAILFGRQLTPSLRGIVQAATQVLNQAMPAIEEFGRQASIALIGVLTAGRGLIDFFRTGSQDDLAQFASGLASLVHPEIIPRVLGVVAALREKLSPALEWLAQTGWPAIQSAAAAVSTFYENTVVKALGAVAEWLGPKLQAAFGWVTTTGWPALQRAGQAVADWIHGPGTEAWRVVTGWIGDEWQRVMGWVTQTGWPSLQRAGQAFTTWLSSTAVPAVQAYADKLSPILKTAAENAAVALDKTKTSATNANVELNKTSIPDNYAKSLDNLWKIGGNVVAFFERLTPLFKPISDWFIRLAENVAVVTAGLAWFGGEIAVRATTWLKLLSDGLPGIATGFVTVAGAVGGFIDMLAKGGVAWLERLAAPFVALKDAIGALDLGKLGQLLGMLRGGAPSGGGSGFRGGNPDLQTISNVGNITLSARPGTWDIVVPGGTGTTTAGGTHGGAPAVDIFAPKGTPILAPVGGVSRPAYYSLGGNATIIAGDDGRFYYFAHGNVPFVPGRVEAGQQIGQVGNTGNAASTPSHLHFAVATDASFTRGASGGSGNISPDIVKEFSKAGGLGDVIAEGIAASVVQGFSEGIAASVEGGVMPGGGMLRWLEEMRAGAGGETAWVEERAAAFKALFEEMQVGPASATEALSRMSAAFPELQARVAAGDISLSSLAANMVTLARNAGLNTEAFDQWSAGTLDAQSALELVVQSAAAADPRFQGLLDTLNTAGSSSAEFALQFLNALAAWQQTPAAAAEVTTATQAVGSTTAQTVGSMAEDWRTVSAAVDDARDRLRVYTDYLFELSPQRLQEQSGGWMEVGDQVLRAAEGVRRYNAALEDVGPPPTGDDDDLPEAHTGARVRRGGVAELETGEVVLTPSQQRRYGLGGGESRIEKHYHLTVNPRPGDEHRVIENFRIMEALYGAS